MGLFDKKPKFLKDIAPHKIRVEKVAVAPKPRPKLAPKAPSRASSYSSSPQPTSSSRTSASTPATAADDRRRSAAASAERKRKPAPPPKRSRVSPVASSRVDFGSDSGSEDDEDWIGALDSRKRQKRGKLEDGRYVDPNRRLKHPRALEGAVRGLDLIHAAQVASLELKCEPVLGARRDEVAVELQYPSLQKPERYELVWSKDKIDAVSSIISVVRHVADTYLTEEQAVPFTHHMTGLVRRLEKASNRNIEDLAGFKAALAEYNDKILELVKDDVVGKNLEKRTELPRSFVAFILEQVYDRTVAPKVGLLAKYENGTDNVYGELLHPFISSMLVEKLQMTSDQVFVDLGSGVGNVVLQAALEIGCESWGCEMMENACNLADAQLKEFTARTSMWGLATGKVRLERGDFRANADIQEVLKRADVVLVNNQAFTSQLNDDLVRMFLDLKSGCKIISLKSFVHDHKSASNDVGSTILTVENFTYPEDYVSWTSASGTYCISTRK
ncbi:related to protein-lysine N-methyltransferase [Cephalotrichum gorgonifer]|uniref:Histone-lysine N-methyltransferase, H3 lysine-79 specific n=1 Tax=Cephalotrichum gorgonifer TaxID=2041049 RepID=A0AAE8MY73_9PEZI|nr:related to protein-lysine N-methyltransferase [Cephalotrichum gorgonifer]